MMTRILNMSYDPEVDSAYYQLDTTPGIDSEEIAEGIVVDYDADNNVVGVELLGLKTWAVVGLSNNSERAAYKVAKVLIEKGHTVIPVHPKAETVHGQKGYTKLSEIKVPIDVVDVFVNSECFNWLCLVTRDRQA